MVQYKHTHFCKFWSNFWHIVLNVPIYLDWIQLRPNWMAFSTECFQSFLCEMCLFSLVMGSGIKSQAFSPLGFRVLVTKIHVGLRFGYHFLGLGLGTITTHGSTEIICKIRNFLLHCFISPQRQRECERPNHLMHFG